MGLPISDEEKFHSIKAYSPSGRVKYLPRSPENMQRYQLYIERQKANRMLWLQKQQSRHTTLTLGRTSELESNTNSDGERQKKNKHL